MFTMTTYIEVIKIFFKCKCINSFIWHNYYTYRYYELTHVINSSVPRIKFQSSLISPFFRVKACRLWTLFIFW